MSVAVLAAREGAVPCRRVVLACVAAGYAVFAATYVPINHWSVGRPAHALFLPGESRLPFVPAFEYLYVLTYVLPLLVVRVRPPSRVLTRLAVAFALTLAVACVTYVAFPVYFERPELRVDSLATYLLSLEYLDPSYNHFPSLHVAITWLVALACAPFVARPRALHLLAAGVSVSTVFVKQHYVVDVVYGFGLAASAWVLAGRVNMRSQPSRTDS